MVYLCRLAMRGLLVGAAVPRRRVDSAQPVSFEPSAILKEVLEVMPVIFFFLEREKKKETGNAR